jgi:hypothetical protein
MAAIVYSLCALTALLCTVLLFRSYFQTQSRLLMWSGLCFAGLTLNNLIVLLDRVMLTFVDLTEWRLAVSLLAMLPLLYGLIWDDE